MYVLFFPLLLGQCGPNGCSIPPSGPQWQPMVVDHTVSQPAVLDIEVIPPNGEVSLDGYPVQLEAGKARFETPPLELGWRYRYRVTARWGDRERAWTLRFSPGQTVHVVLRQDEAAASPSPPADETPSSLQPSASSVARGQLPVVEQDGVQNFGIDRAGLNGSAERITLGGRQITRAEATQILQAGSLADDSSKLRLTLIGSESDRGRVLDDLKGPLSDIAGQCLVQDYPPDHWAVTGAGFYTAGKPTIYVQSPDGKVLHRQDDYADGADGLRLAFENIRKPDPNYRPDKDRDLRRLADGSLSRLIDVLARPFRVILSWLLAAALVFVLIVLVTKGWLFYLLGLLVSLVCGPPPQAKTASTSRRRPARRRPARQLATPSRARR